VNNNNEETAMTVLPANALRTETDLTILNPVMSLDVARQRIQQLQEFVAGYLINGEDFGTIPGTQKPTLYKSGADKLCDVYGLADDYELLRELTHEEPHASPALFDYAFRCRLTRKGTDILISTGMGSCSSYETRYRYRDSKRKCPQCGQPTIIKGKEEYGGGWLCFARRGGCGAKFSDSDPAIIGQTIGRVDNEDLADIKNTIIKMAKKRAKVDAVLSATRSSGLFTQDMEDMAQNGHVADHEPQEPRAAAPAARQAQPAAPRQAVTSGNTGVVPTISEAQGKRLYAIATQNGYDKSAILEYLESDYGISSIDEIPKAQYGKIVVHFGGEDNPPPAKGSTATRQARPSAGAPF